MSTNAVVAILQKAIHEIDHGSIESLEVLVRKDYDTQLSTGLNWMGSPIMHNF